jgi:hypothetical protein
MCGKVLVTLLVTGILGNKVKIFSADDNGSVHLGGDNSACENTTANRDPDQLAMRFSDRQTYNPVNGHFLSDNC